MSFGPPPFSFFFSRSPSIFSSFFPFLLFPFFLPHQTVIRLISSNCQTRGGGRWPWWGCWGRYQALVVWCVEARRLQVMKGNSAMVVHNMRPSPLSSLRLPLRRNTTTTTITPAPAGGVVRVRSSSLLASTAPLRLCITSKADTPPPTIDGRYGGALMPPWGASHHHQRPQQLCCCWWWCTICSSWGFLLHQRQISCC